MSLLILSNTSEVIVPPKEITILDGGLYPEIDPQNPELKIVPGHLNYATGAILTTAAGLVAVTDFHKRSILAGARAITTASWNISEHIQGNTRSDIDFEVLAGVAIEAAFEGIRRAKVDEDDITVFLSIRSLGDCYTMEGLPPDTKEGNGVIRRVLGTNIEALRSGLGERQAVLLFETGTNTREIEIAREEAERIDSDMDFGATICPSDDGSRLRGDENPAKFLSVMEGAAVVGVNCHNANVITKMLGRFVAIRSARSALKPSIDHPKLMAYAQGYTPPHHDSANRDQHCPISKGSPEETRAEYLRQANVWLALGAKIIGGCCGTTVSDIQDICKTVKTWERDREAIRVNL